MKEITSFFTRHNMPQVLLACVLLLYIVMGYSLPYEVASIVNSPYGKVAVIVLAICLFMSTHPIVGVLGFIVAFDILMRSSQHSVLLTSQSGTTEEEKVQVINHLNNATENTIQTSNTLEQEVIRQMAPLVNSTYPVGPNATSFSPVMDNLHDAAPLNYDGII